MQGCSGRAAQDDIHVSCCMEDGAPVVLAGWICGCRCLFARCSVCRIHRFLSFPRPSPFSHCYSRQLAVSPLSACRFNGDHSQIRNALSIENTLTGYVFLVDRENRVRWKGSGTAEEVELEELKEVLMQLEQDGELGKGHRGKGGRSRRGQRRRS